MGNTLDPNFKADRDARLRAELESIMDPDAKILFEKKLQLVADIEAVSIPDPMVLSVPKHLAEKRPFASLIDEQIGTELEKNE